MAKIIILIILVAILWWWWKRSALYAAIKDARATREDSERAEAEALPRREARSVLGVDANADADEIRAAHRRLIAGVHPDRGGSADLTSRINAARDTLLAKPRD